MLKKFIDLILYSNLFIACCAVAMTWQTQLLLGQNLVLTPLIGLVFCATLVIYALHRVVGMSKVKEFLDVERFHVIQTYKSHILFYAAVAVISGAICFFYLNISIQVALVVPALLSVAYVLPFLGKKRAKRLRDVHFIKIFLIAVVWAYVTVLLPAIELDIWQEKRIWSMFVERSLFVFCITLPFDIRDLKVDKHNKVNTLPAKLGLTNTLRLALLLMTIFVVLCYVNYDSCSFLALLISAISTCIFIYFSPKYTHDYYFTGLMDGTMIVQFFLCYSVTVLLC